MTVERAMELILGLFFMIAAFKTRGMRGAFSMGHGPLHPISRTGRVIVFSAGLAVFLAGLNVIH